MWDDKHSLSTEQEDNVKQLPGQIFSVQKKVVFNISALTRILLSEVFCCSCWPVFLKL